MKANTRRGREEELLAAKVYRDVKKKRKLFPGLSPASLVSFVLPLSIHVLV